MYKLIHQTYLEIILFSTIALTIVFLVWDIFAPLPQVRNFDATKYAIIPKAKYNHEGQVVLSDGDSFKMANTNDSMLLFAIDSPELLQNCTQNGAKWQCGLHAKAALMQKIDGAKIICRGNEMDRYKRLIATCYLPLEFKVNGGTLLSYENLNEWMVKNGWAIAYRYYSERYVGAEKFAKLNKLGIWRGTFMQPYNWRRKQRR